MRTVPFYVLGLGLLNGCAEWPRFGHPIGGEDAAQEPGSTDPRAIVPVTWTSLAETEANDLPTDAETQRSSLSQGIGVGFTGTLATAGWDSGATPTPIEDADCAASSGIRTAGVEPGDYIGDVDFFLVDPTEDGVLCARALVEVEAPERGWDLLVFPADACGVPGAPTRTEDGPVGYGLGGHEGGWAVPVTAGSRVAVLLASYAPNAAEAEFGYALGLSMIAAPSSAAVAPVCPLLSSEE